MADNSHYVRCKIAYCWHSHDSPFQIQKFTLKPQDVVDDADCKSAPVMLIFSRPIIIHLYQSSRRRESLSVSLKPLSL